MTNNQASIDFLLKRVVSIGHRFGTLTDKTAIFCAVDLGIPELSQNDLALFKRVIETGAVTTRFFRPPNGYDVLSFFIRLKDEQERRMGEAIQAQREEQAECCTKMWFEKINALDGDFKAAKKEVIKMWGDKTQMDESTRSIFNQSYESAKAKWESQNKI